MDLKGLPTHLRTNTLNIYMHCGFDIRSGHSIFLQNSGIFQNIYHYFIDIIIVM